MNFRDIIEIADQTQRDSFGDIDHDLVVVIEGGDSFMGHVSIDDDDMVTIHSRLHRPPAATTGTIAAPRQRPPGVRNDGGTSQTPVYVPLSRIIFAHYATREA